MKNTLAMHTVTIQDTYIRYNDKNKTYTDSLQPHTYTEITTETCFNINDLFNTMSVIEDTPDGRKVSGQGHFHYKLKNSFKKFWKEKDKNSYE
jgi:hypothetical protein